MDKLNSLGRLLLGALVLAGNVYLIFVAYIFFAGGTVWPLSWQVTGSAFHGVAFLVVGLPIAETVLYWVAMLFVLPFAVVAVTRNGKRGSASAD